MERKNLLLLQLDGLESFLHSLPAIYGIQKKFPEHTIHVVAQKSCEEIVGFLPEQLVLHTVESASDAVSVDLNSVYLQLGNSEQTKAFAARLNPQNAISGEAGQLWQLYKKVSDANGSYNPFHQADIYKNISESLFQDVNYELLPSTAVSTEAYISAEPHIKLAFSAESQSSEEIQNTLHAILALGLNLKIYLVGTIKDRRNSSEALAGLGLENAVVDLCGKLSVKETANFLQKADLLLSRPGLYTTLAAGFGTFCLTIDSNSGEAASRYPYGHGHLVVQRANATSSKEWFEILAGLVHFTICGGDGALPNQAQWQGYFDANLSHLLGKARVHITQRVQLLVDEKSQRTDLQLHPLLYTGADFQECMKSFYRLLWEKDLNQCVVDTHALSILEDGTVSSLTSVLKPLEQMTELAIFGQKYIQLIKNDIGRQNLEAAKHNSTRLQEVDDLIRVIGDSHFSLAPLVDFFFLTQENMTAEGVAAVSDELSTAYLTLQHHALILLDLHKSLYKNTYEQEAKLRLDIAGEGESHG